VPTQNADLNRRSFADLQRLGNHLRLLERPRRDPDNVSLLWLTAVSAWHLRNLSGFLKARCLQHLEPRMVGSTTLALQGATSRTVVSGKLRSSYGYLRSGRKVMGLLSAKMRVPDFGLLENRRDLSDTAKFRLLISLCSRSDTLTLGAHAIGIESNFSRCFNFCGGTFTT
jgi:hypothetical protein